MFTWICPKCGGEVPPSYDDCPRCKASEADSPTAVAEPSDSAPPSAPPTPRADPPPRPSVAAALPEESGRRLPPTLVALLAAGGICALLAVLYLYVLPNSAAKGTAAAPAALEEPGAPVTAERGSHPLAKHLEVAGLRLPEHRDGRVKVQYLVVNHSSAELPPLNMTITLVSGDRNFFEFPVKVPSLGPFEVRELETTLKTNLKPYEFPDWQMMRARFRVEDQR